MINWKVRFKNPQWVSAFVAQLLIIVELVVAGGHAAGLWSFTWSKEIDTWVLTVVNAVLVAMSMMGIVQDPTTSGYGDNEQAKTFSEPK